MADKYPNQHDHQTVGLTTPHIKLFVIQQLLKLGRLVYYMASKEYDRQVPKPAIAQTHKNPGQQVPRLTSNQADKCPGRQVTKLTNAKTYKNPGRQVPKLTSTKPMPINQHPYSPCIGNEYLTSDKETNSNKWRSHHLRKKKSHVFPLTHSAEQQSYPAQKRLRCMWTTSSSSLILVNNNETIWSKFLGHYEGIT